MKIKTVAKMTLPLLASLSFASYGEEPTALPTWSELMKELEPVGDEVAKNLLDPSDEQARMDFFRFLHEMMSQAYFALQYQDPAHPEFWPMFNQAYAYGFANPDDSYYQAALADDGVYKIRGHRGTTRIVDFEIGSGDFIPYGKGELGPSLAHYDLDKNTTVKDDGTFEVILSPERPEGWKGDWWKLDKSATYLWVRQRAYDWTNEVDGRFAIERIDTPVEKPRRSAEEIAAAMRQLPKWTAAWAAWLPGHFVQKPYAEGIINKVVALDLGGTGGIEGQRYLQGIFDIKPDEALIIETELPEECRYWSFHLADEYTDTLDWQNRQTQTNGHYAHVDSDGKFRVVLSWEDPGVPNWLDVYEHQKGLIVGRWKECTSYPVPTTTKVKLSEVAKHLPKDTPSVSAEEREAYIRERRAAAQMRRRW